MEMEDARQRVQPKTFTIDRLVNSALRERFGPGARKVNSPFYEQQKRSFEEVLLRNSWITSSRKPQEISKIQVDVNEKIYSNNGDGRSKSTDGDNSKVTIVKSSEVSEGFNYQQATSSGLEWGAGANIGAQFGLPQVGIGMSGGASTNFTKTSSTTTTESHSKENKIGQQSHHEESVIIPPGHKVTVTMTSYRIKYQLEYTMKYTVLKSSSMYVRYYTSWSCGLCSISCNLDATHLLHSLPDYREEGQFVSFTQQGHLTWFADRMEVDKIEQLAA